MSFRRISDLWPFTHTADAVFPAIAEQQHGPQADDRPLMPAGERYVISVRGNLPPPTCRDGVHEDERPDYLSEELDGCELA